LPRVPAVAANCHPSSIRQPRLITALVRHDLNWPQLLAPFLIAGFGNALFIVPDTQFIVATVDRREAIAASGVIATGQCVGSAINITVTGTVLFAVANLGRVHSASERIGAFSRGTSSSSPCRAGSHDRASGWLAQESLMPMARAQAVVRDSTTAAESNSLPRKNQM
jgi:hypothetical protein